MLNFQGEASRISEVLSGKGRHMPAFYITHHLSFLSSTGDKIMAFK